jgi:hypothetical protein
MFEAATTVRTRSNFFEQSRTFASDISGVSGLTEFAG